MGSRDAAPVALKSRVARSVFWLVWSRGFIQAASFVTTIFVARIIDPSAFGLMALAGVWISVLVLICDLGLANAVVQFRDLRKEELNFCFLLANVTALLLYAMLFQAAPAIASWFNNPELAAVLRVSSLVLPITAVRCVHDALLRKDLRFDSLSKVEMTSAAATIPSVLLLAYEGWGVWALVAGMLIGALSRTLGTFWYVRWLPSLIINGSRFLQISRFSFASFGSRAVWATYDQADAFVLGKISGEVAVGFYAMAKELAHLPVAKISSLVNELAYPVMAELQDSPHDMGKALLRAVRLVGCLSVPLCVGLALVAEDAVRAALTDKWLSIVPVLQILCVTALIKSVDVLLPPILRARNQPGFLLRYNLILLLVMPIAFLVGGVSLREQGVAIAWVTAYPVVMCWMALRALREVYVDWRTLFGQLRMPIAAAGAMAIAVVLIQHSLSGSDATTTWIRLIASVTGGALVYVGILWFWGGQLAVELRELLLWIVRRRKGEVLEPELIGSGATPGT